MDAFHRILLSKEKQNSEDAAKELNPLLEMLENELVARKDGFFGGNKPSMVPNHFFIICSNCKSIYYLLAKKLQRVIRLVLKRG